MRGPQVVHVAANRSGMEGRRAVARLLTGDPDAVLNNVFDTWPADPASISAEALTPMSTARDPVVYFFCHGIRTPDNYPGLVIGAVNDIPITQSTFGEYVRWRRTRPLVFVNGCETAALEPDSAYTLVGALVRECGAAGVIGTETTVFEPTATRFAEVFHAAFLTEWYTVAEAVRRARLALLEDGNPLGLGYTAYAPVALRLELRRQASDPPPHR